MLALIAQIIKFGRQRAKWWLIPIIIFMLVLGLGLFVLQSAVVTQFIYAIF